MRGPTRSPLPGGSALSVSSYRLYMLYVLISFVGSTGHIVAVTWILLQQTGRPSSVPELFLLSAIPGLLLAPVIGRLVERVDKRLVLMGVDAFSAVLVGILPVLYWTGHLHPWHLYTVEFVQSFGGAAFFVATRAYVREIVPPDALLSATGTTAVVYQIGNTLGALAGGLMVAYLSPGAALAANSFSFVVSFAGLAGLGGWRFRERITTAAPVFSKGLLRDFGVAVSFIRRRAHLRALMLVLLVFLGLQRFLLGELAPFVKDGLHVDGFGYGSVQAGFTIGSMIGGLCLSWFVARVGGRAALGGGAVVLLAAILLFSRTTGLAAAIPLYLLVGVSLQVWAYAQTSLQRELPVEVEGRVLAVLSLLQSAGFVLVFMLSTALTAVVDERTVYAIVVAIAVGVLAAPLRRLVRAPDVPAARSPTADATYAAAAPARK